LIRFPLEKAPPGAFFVAVDIRAEMTYDYPYRNQEIIMEYPKTRKEAKETGALFYFTGEPCSRGHVALRKVKGVCVECMKEDWAVDNAKRSLKPKTEAAKEAAKRYYKKNRAAVIARAAQRPKHEIQAYRREYKKNHIDAVRADTSVRKRRHREATPKWITAEEKAAMRTMYMRARQLTKLTGERYVVDHIVPLRGETVCGLHVPWNLRVITQEENLAKSNKLVDQLQTPVA
jgi:5-methylcytosine-specific restriction endonuclease McrA